MAAATTPTLGSMGEFTPTSSGEVALSSYVERLEFYFEANDITTEDKKRAVLCTVSGPATYAVIRSLCSPALPSATSYADIVQKLSVPFNPKPSVTVQRFQFGKRDQRPGESIADYIAELRRLSEHCNFRTTLEDMLHDRLQQLKVLGSVTVQVNYRGRQEQLRLVVVKGAGVNLLGRDWFKALGIELKVNQLRMDKVSQSPSLTSVLKKHSKVFQPGLGKSQGPPVRVEVQPHAQPRFYKPWPVPFALLPQVDEALNKLIGQGILEPARHSEWATPVVPVDKKDGSIRICGDYKSTLNPVIHWETYPLPTPEELFAKLAGFSKFSKLDFDQAYQQLVVDDKTADLLTMSPHLGLFRVMRLQFGVAVAVAIFQRYKSYFKVSKVCKSV
ncbi:uncharacterized protein K02A2.6-like [Dermacentor silvarum]|uniref:uncharacterized protein K02A2.6-like n=1 Tax=Dermacentor silvarum TaxID=543639 RepID=UPI002101602C|nr:uncharacterized protein K02A2.6-like [Dermacentor silvarum]